MDWVAEILWTRWQHSHGLHGNIPVDWVAEIRGIRSVLRPTRRDGEQPPRGSRNQHARAAPDPELHGLRQHPNDPEGTGTTPLAGEADTARLCRLDALDLGARQPVWTVRPGHERPTGVAVIKMAAGDTTACSTPIRSYPAPGTLLQYRLCLLSPCPAS